MPAIGEDDAPLAVYGRSTVDVGVVFHFFFNVSRTFKHNVIIVRIPETHHPQAISHKWFLWRKALVHRIAVNAERIFTHEADGYAQSAFAFWLVT